MATYKAVWIAAGKQYVEEALVSAHSFRKHNPSIQTHLITPHDINAFDVFNSASTFKYDKAASWYLNLVYVYQDLLDLADRIFLFDTDTYICAPLYGPMRLLNKYDFLGCHAPGRSTTGTIHDELGNEFPEINVGFLAFNTNASVRALFNRWLTLYLSHLPTYRNNDQGPLRDALYEWDGKLYVLPPEYNFRFTFGGQVRGLVHILHGRCNDIKAAAERINATKDIRAWRKGEF